RHAVDVQFVQVVVAEERGAAKLGLVGVQPGGLAEGGELYGRAPCGQIDLRAGGQVLARDGDRLAAGVQDELGGALRGRADGPGGQDVAVTEELGGEPGGRAAVDVL